MSGLPARLRTTAARLGAVTRALGVSLGGSAHPQVSGRIEARGAEGAIEVVRDRFGVPHIFANSEADAFFGQGFLHAQDRLFQMEGMRRMAAGRVAEVTGPGALESDRFMRRLGLADRAGRDLARLDGGDRAVLEAYARGVNAGTRSFSTLPPEFALLGSAPEPWHAEHSLLLARLLIFTFATNWDTELLRERLLHALGPERAAALDPAFPADARTATGEPAGAAERVLAAYHAAREAGLPGGGASNAWALDGSRTVSGRPLLACDPHLEAQIPGLFHVSHVRGGEVDVVGAGIPGAPGIIAGHNGAIAWGVTAGLADVSDCYIETVHPEDPTRYLTPEGWATGRTRIERIAVLGAEAVEERVLETRHGPVIGPALPGEERAVALRSTALEDGDLASALIGMMRARDGDAFEQALDRWPGATFNFVWASREGGVGYRLAGRVPRRAPGEGLLPRDGARSPGPPAAVPPRELPRLVDPADGAVVSANDAPGGDLELGEEWCERWRAERIAALLADDERHTVHSMQAIQLDLHSAPLVALRDLLLERGALHDAGTAAAEASELLARWDGQVTAASAAAAVIETVYREVASVLVVRLAGTEAALVLGAGLSAVVSNSSFHYRLQGPLLDALAEARPPWCDGVADRDRLLRAATARALRALRARLGRHPSRWRWGALHRQRLRHPLHGVPVVGRRFSRGPYPVGGDVNTVWQGGYSIHRGPDGGGFSPAYRQVIDLDDPDRSTFQLPAGNSGVPGHPRYDDCAQEFLEGRYRPLLYSRAAVERHREHTLALEPA